MSRRHGFTLIEMVIVIGIVGIISMVAISMLTTSQRDQTLRATARALVNAINEARTVAASGRFVSQPAPSNCIANCNVPSTNNGPGRSPNTPPRVSRSGIIVERTSFTVFADDDRDPLNGEITSLIFNLERELGAGYQITEPLPGTRIVFQANGLRDTSTPDRLRVRDMVSGREYSIAVGLGGLARIESASR
jgi:prepilin-type N-terminal cleavage/methylation domain-containing protein